MNPLFKKWNERESKKLRKLESKFEELEMKFAMLELRNNSLRSDYCQLEKRVGEKEVTHVQKVKVELTKPLDFDGWYP